MLNKYPLWKNSLLLVLLILGFIYAAPNLYPDEPAVQITSAAAGTQLSESVLTQSQSLLDEAKISYKGGSFEGNSALLRLDNSVTQRSIC